MRQQGGGWPKRFCVATSHWGAGLACSSSPLQPSHPTAWASLRRDRARPGLSWAPREVSSHCAVFRAFPPFPHAAVCADTVLTLPLYNNPRSHHFLLEPWWTRRSEHLQHLPRSSIRTPHCNKIHFLSVFVLLPASPWAARVPGQAQGEASEAISSGTAFKEHPKPSVTETILF